LSDEVVFGEVCIKFYTDAETDEETLRLSDLLSDVRDEVEEFVLRTVGAKACEKARDQFKRIDVED